MCSIFSLPLHPCKLIRNLFTFLFFVSKLVCHLFKCLFKLLNFLLLSLNYFLLSCKLQSEISKLFGILIL